MQRWRKFLWWKMSTRARFHRWTPGRRTARTRRSPPQGKSSETKEQNCKAHKKKQTHTRLHWPAPPQTKMPLQRCWATKATANPKQNQERGESGRRKKKAKENATKNHQHYKTQSKSKAQGLSATCSQTYVGRAPLGFTQKSKHAALRNRGPESSKTRHRGEEKKRTQKAHMKKPNEQQQSDLRDRGDQKYAHPQDTHQPSKKTRFQKKKANFFNLQRQQHMSVRP